MSTINLSPEAISSAISGAILGSLDAKTREDLIRQSLEHLLTPKKDSSWHGQKLSPLQEAFNIAVTSLARDEVKKNLETNQKVRSEIEKLVSDAFTKIFTTKRDEVVNKMADAFVQGMKIDTY